MKKLSVALLVGVMVLMVVSISFADNPHVDIYPLYVDGETGDTATPFAIHVTITGWTDCSNADAYLKVYSYLYNWNGAKWYAGTTWSKYPTIHIDDSGNWSGWTYLKSNGRTTFRVRAAKTDDTDTTRITSDEYTFTQLLDMSINGAWIECTTSGAPANKPVVAYDSSENVISTYGIRNDGTAPAGYFKVAVPTTVTITKFEARNADNTVYATDTGSWTSSTPGDTETISDASLPVTLSSFAAIPTDSGVTLKWRTESEVGNVGFSIYRGEEKNGKYTKIAFVKGAGNSAMPNDYQFIDKKAETGKTYFYYIEGIDIAGERNKSEIIKVTFPSVQSVAPVPKEFRLLQNYPNPFNPETWLPYELAKDATVTIRIYNVNGLLVRYLDLGVQKAGSYIDKNKAAYWNGKDRFGQPVSSGVYFYMLKADDFQAIRRMVILK